MFPGKWSLGRYSWLILGVGLLFAVYLLPADTSLSEVKRTGTLTACVPIQRPPLVTGDAARPGIEIELISAIAAELGLRPSFSTVAAMGQDFDPSRWRITRAQCQIVAGGITDSRETRSFLEVTPAYGTSGWTVLAMTDAPKLDGARAVVLVTSQGVDRIALSRYLREHGTTITLARSPEDLVAAINAGTADYAIADALSATGLVGDNSLVASSLPPPLDPRPLVLGLWKGDLTLKNAIADAFFRLERSGRLEEMVARYLGA